MKCPNCGANIGLEDVYCTYCGSPNPFAKQHQEQMRQYQQQFEETKAEVEKKANRFANIAVPLTILAILLAALIGAAIFAFSADDIGRTIRTRQTAANAKEYRSRIEKALDDGDYGLIDYMYNTDDLYLVTSSYSEYPVLMEYEMIFRACRYYASIYDVIGDWIMGQEYRFSDEWIDDTCEYLATDILNLYSIESKQWFDESCMTQEKLDQVHAIQERVTAMLITYIGFTREETEQIADQSETKLQRIFMERFSQESADSAS